mmetsp:Transcript_13068/g.31058  ORF Transcript_13068/g.31058 Transcript_13068/m.31058 type:complete len:236 (+) Transcript_13068:292-999(+)
MERDQRTPLDFSVRGKLLQTANHQLGSLFCIQAGVGYQAKEATAALQHDSRIIFENSHEFQYHVVTTSSDEQVFAECPLCYEMQQSAAALVGCAGHNTIQSSLRCAHRQIHHSNCCRRAAVPSAALKNHDQELKRPIKFEVARLHSSFYSSGSQFMAWCDKLLQHCQAACQMLHMLFLRRQLLHPIQQCWNGEGISFGQSIDPSYQSFGRQACRTLQSWLSNNSMCWQLLVSTVF